jgi:hypothetical protein
MECASVSDDKPETSCKDENSGLVCLKGKYMVNENSCLFFKCEEGGDDDDMIGPGVPEKVKKVKIVIGCKASEAQLVDLIKTVAHLDENKKEATIQQIREAKNVVRAIFS